MKTKLQTIFLLSFALAFAAPKVNAQTLIQYWDFNLTRPCTSSGGGDSLGTVYSYLHTPAQDTTQPGSALTWPLTANYSAPSLAPGRIIYSRPSTIQPGATIRDSTLDNGTGGTATVFDFSGDHSYFSSSDSSFPGGNMFIRARNPSSGCVMYVYIPTTGYKNISFEFAFSASSAKGATYNLVSYSTTQIPVWKSLTQKMDTFSQGAGKRTPDTLLMINPKTSGSGWDTAHINFTSDSTNVNNNAYFIVRLMPAGTSSLGTSGNDRYDNFAVWGTKIPTGINELTASAAGYDIYPNPANNMVNLTSTQYTGMKTITIYNVVGQTVSVSQTQSKQTQISTSTLSPGMYFVEVLEMNTGNKYTLKLVKN